MTSPLPLEGLTSRAGAACGEAVAPARPALTLVVLGVPIPQGSMKGFVNPKTGRAILTSDNKKTRPWRQDVAVEARDATTAQQPWFPKGTPVRVDITFTMPKPVSAPKRRRTWPVTRPDIDKLGRAVLDALTGTAINDDSQVIDLNTSKRYPGEGHGSLTTPGAHIRITEVLA